MKIVSKSGMAMVSGSIGEPDVKYVGDNNSILVKFGVRVSNEKIDGQWKSEYSNVDCWGSVAESAQYFQKGDIVFVCGAETNREYNGKNYSTIKADFVIVMPEPAATYVERMGDGITAPAGTSDFEEIDDNSGDLPF